MIYALRTFPGKLYPINPHAIAILGLKRFPLKALGNPVDLVILTIPLKAALPLCRKQERQAPVPPSL